MSTVRRGGDGEVRPDRRAATVTGDEEVELDSRRHDPAEDVGLAELVEPQGVGEDPRRRVHEQQRHTQDDHDDGRAAARPEDERPVVRAVAGSSGSSGAAASVSGNGTTLGVLAGDASATGAGGVAATASSCRTAGRGPVRRCPSRRPFCERKASTPCRLGTQT